MDRSFAWRAMLVFAAAVFLVQSAGFGVRAVFRDSIEGQRRDSEVTGCPKLSGVKTNAQNAAALQDVVDYAAENGWEEDAARSRKMITFGDVPGFCWLFDMPSALSHDWPDMNTYPAEKMREDLGAIRSMSSEPPAVIVNEGNVDLEEPQEAKKWEALQAFLQENGYECRMDNGTYRIYE